MSLIRLSNLKLILKHKNLLKVLRKYSLLLVLFVSACQTGPVNYSNKTRGYWKAKALIEDKKNSKNYIVYLDINAVKSKMLRMDIISPLGGHLASIILKGKKASYLNVESRKIYVGKASSKTMGRVTSVPIDPNLFYNVVFDIPIKNKTWTCVNNKDGQLSKCKDLKTKTIVIWGRSVKARKSVSIENKKVKLQINFKHFKDKLEARENLFTFKKIPGFKIIKLR